MADEFEYSDYTIEQPEVDESIEFQLEDNLAQNDIWAAESSEKNPQADKEPVINQEEGTPQKGTQEGVHDFVNRPALQIEDGHSFALHGLVPQLFKPLTVIGPTLAPVLKSVGRIVTPFVEDNKNKLSVGTGWLIGDDIIATNQHVAKRFAHTEAPFPMRAGFHPTINFHPNGKQKGYSVKIIKCLYMFKLDRIDFALCKIEKRTGNLADLKPIECDPQAELQVKNPVAVVGYPAKPSKELYSEDVIKKIDLVFDNEYGVKKLSPGLIEKPKPTVLHDCSTLGGNSGSVVIDLQTGKAVALHAGSITSSNYAVPISYITNVYNNLVE